MEDLARDTLWLALTIAAPALLAALAVAFAVGLFQAATQIPDPGLSFVPRLIVVLLVLVLMGGWMSGLLVDFARTLLTDFPARIE